MSKCLKQNPMINKPRRALSRMRMAMVIRVQHLEQMSAALKLALCYISDVELCGKNSQIKQHNRFYLQQLLTSS